jgi:hypothetical protein
MPVLAVLQSTITLTTLPTDTHPFRLSKIYSPISYRVVP